MAPIQLTAIITPNPGKKERFLELFEKCCRYVKANEPGIHRYEVHEGIKDLNNGKELLVVLEGYDDQEALDSHLKTEPVVTMMATMEKEKVADVQIIRTTDGPRIKSRM